MTEQKDVLIRQPITDFVQDLEKRKIHFRTDRSRPGLMNRWATVELWRMMKGPLPPLDFVSNGCTMSPDRYKKVDWTLACHIHDWHYDHRCVEIPRTWQGRKMADAWFGENISTCAMMNGGDWAQRNILPRIYWAAVRKAGAGAFDYAEGEAPEGKLSLVREAAGLFIPNGVTGLVTGVLLDD